MPIQILLLAVIAVLLVSAWRRVGQAGSSRLTAVAWTVFWAGAAAVVLRPDIASTVADALGVGRGADLVVYAAIVGLYWLMFRVFLRLDRIERDMTALVRSQSIDARRASAPGRTQAL